MCGKSFSRKDNLLKHRKTHGIAGPFVCQTCGKSFVVKHYYQIHIASHSKDQPFVCETCGKKFAQKQYLVTHQHRHNRKAAIKPEVTFFVGVIFESLFLQIDHRRGLFRAYIFYVLWVG
jgi:transposase-like protein